jgi:hypothetical protein
VTSKQKARSALDRAGAALRVLQNALLNAGTPLDAVALQLKSISEDLGYEQYARWMKLELEGYKTGTLGELLKVTESDPLPGRISSYRRHTGQVILLAGSKRLDLPYTWFFSESISRLKEMAARHAAETAQVTITIPAAQIPNQFIRDFILQRTPEKVLRVGFLSAIYPRILSGLRGEMVALTSELTSAHKVLESTLED